MAEVTAVLVEGALANAANDKELSRHDLKLKAPGPGPAGSLVEIADPMPGRSKSLPPRSCRLGPEAKYVK